MPVRIEIVFDGDDPMSVMQEFLEGNWPKVVSLNARGYRDYSPYQPKGHYQVDGDIVTTKINYTSSTDWKSKLTKPHWWLPLTPDEEKDDK